LLASLLATGIVPGGLTAGARAQSGVVGWGTQVFDSL
jgi:hypothetical protein